MVLNMFTVPHYLSVGVIAIQQEDLEMVRKSEKS